MIKRTTEKILSIIGMVIVVILGLLGAGALILSGNEGFINNLSQINSAQSSMDPASIVDSLKNTGGILIWSAIISLILAIIALFNLKKHSKAILAGILFISAGIVIFFPFPVLGFSPAILFIITGIISLVKKPQEVNPYRETM